MEKSLAWASCGEEEKACVGWIKRYFNDCVCSPSGELSFGLGMVSLVCWGIAEIPQIITNFHSKSGHGVSLAFLLTWVIGSVPLNFSPLTLAPCYSYDHGTLLPTQLYTALLYTATTVVLVLQTLYYDYWVRWWKKKRGLQAPLEVIIPPPFLSSSIVSSRCILYVRVTSLHQPNNELKQVPISNRAYLSALRAHMIVGQRGHNNCSKELVSYCSLSDASGRRHRIIGREHLRAAVGMDYGGHLHGRSPASNISECERICLSSTPIFLTDI
ncbi:hypothetical protein GW17_00007107 [Ensete ventricosum]|nr:hypothetical protein GW17_00007107 [Ensete ventricosum]